MPAAFPAQFVCNFFFLSIFTRECRSGRKTNFPLWKKSFFISFLLLLLLFRLGFENRREFGRGQPLLPGHDGEELGRGAPQGAGKGHDGGGKGALEGQKVPRIGIGDEGSRRGKTIIIFIIPLKVKLNRHKMTQDPKWWFIQWILITFVLCCPWQKWWYKQCDGLSKEIWSQLCHTALRKSEVQYKQCVGLSVEIWSQCVTLSLVKVTVKTIWRLIRWKLITNVWHCPYQKWPNKQRDGLNGIDWTVDTA